MTTCQQAIELLAEFVEGSLGADARKSLEGHLSQCAPCERLLEGYRKTSSLCRESLNKEAPAELRDRLMTFLRSRICGDDS